VSGRPCPVEVGFQTKPQLARIMLECALDAGVPASWITADEVYGGDPALRRWLEGRGVSYVLAVKGTEPLGTATWGSVRATAVQLAAGVPVEQWVACSAGHGAKGRRLYDWARVELTAPPTAAARGGCWCAAAAATASWPSTPATARPKPPCSAWSGGPGPGGRSRRASAGQNEVGLDHYEVRKWPGWYRHITLALLAHALLVVPAPRPPSATAQTGTRRPDQPARPVPADGARGPLAAGRPDLDVAYPGWLRAGLVTMAAPPPGPRPPRTLSTTRTTSAAGVLPLRTLSRSGRRRPWPMDETTAMIGSAADQEQHLRDPLVDGKATEGGRKQPQLGQHLGDHDQQDHPGPQAEAC
jgi:hypothetical protein